MHSIRTKITAVTLCESDQEEEFQVQEAGKEISNSS